MKVYILLESSGDYDDYREYIHSIYLDKDKCESVKSELESVADKIKKCDECVCSGYCIPDCDCDDEEGNCDERRIQYAKDNCDNADPYIEKWTDSCGEFERLDCHNKLDAYSGGYRYRIEEIEVVE